ncbi:aspartate carbamoyltransferase [Candidatus Woesearchaeota archaeon]|nr:aspartate carbamoyltransferase [Candidatus Woesearchaeota archaeon]
MDFLHRDIISINDFSKDEIVYVLESAKAFEHMRKPILKDSVLGVLFFEPSTRTRLSFESAMAQLGGKTIGFADPLVSSSTKGESLLDTVKIVSGYCDAIVIRHPLEGSARLAAEASEIPVINGGDGANQHPTQTLLDLYTIKKCQGRISGLNIAMVGDLKYGRTVHSLACALSKFGCRLYFVSPESLKIPKHIIDDLQNSETEYSEHKEVGEVIKECDIVYMTRIQKERFPDPAEYERIAHTYAIEKDVFREAKPTMKIMHPLPRVSEIPKDIDDSEHAYYFEQAANGLVVRKALLALILGGVK